MASRYSPRPVGLERALQHIEEARRLTAELGGSDRDVKEYFFSLPAHQLRVILDAYELRHGRAAREYAEETLPKWRSGRVTMSGMVASRLFSLLPPRMPLAAKYKLTENLWRHVGPSSRKTLRVGLDADLDDVMAAIHEHIEAVVLDYKIPINMERRFDWLSAGDVQVKQDLLNHLRQMEKALVVEGARAQLPVMFDHLREEDGHHTHRLAQILRIGKHELELLIDKRLAGVKMEEPVAVAQAAGAAISSGRNLGWLFVLVLIVLVALGWLLSDDENREFPPVAVEPAAPPATGLSQSQTPRVTPITRPRVTPIARPTEVQERAEPTHPTVHVTGEVVNLRAGPSMDYRVVGQARGGERAEELEQSRGWVRLRLEKSGTEGWMFGRYVGRDPPVAGSVARRPQEPSLAPAEPTALRSPPPTEVSDDAIRQIIVEQSIAQYPGSCPCPYDVDRGGRRCGGRSAYSRPGGASPLCYPSDVSASAVTAYRQALAAR